MRPFRRRGGDVVARLDPAEAHVLGLLLDQLDQLLAADPDDVDGDPVMARLLPAGHRSDPELAADYRELTEAALRSGKTDDLAAVRATLPVDGGQLRLDPEQAGSCCAPPTTCGWRSASGSGSPRTPSRPRTRREEGQQLAVYYWLTALQGSLVDAVAAGRDARR
jgi:hypothetical protein